MFLVLLWTMHSTCSSSFAHFHSEMCSVMQVRRVELSWKCCSVKPRIWILLFFPYNPISSKWSRIKDGLQRSPHPVKGCPNSLSSSLACWDNVLIRPLLTSALDRPSCSCAFLTRTAREKVTNSWRRLQHYWVREQQPPWKTHRLPTVESLVHFIIQVNISRNRPSMFGEG